MNEDIPKEQSRRREPFSKGTSGLPHFRHIGALRSPMYKKRRKHWDAACRVSDRALGNWDDLTPRADPLTRKCREKFGMHVFFKRDPFSPTPFFSY